MTTYTGLTTPADWICANCGFTREQHHCIEGFARQKYKFVAMLRIKNEEQWIAEVIESIRPLCDRIFIMDDHSTDRTRAVIRGFEAKYYPGEKVVLLDSPFEGLDESRDKNWLYDQIMRVCEPEWILCIDGDEVLEKNGPAMIRRFTQETEARAFALKIVFLWGDREHYRSDRIYNDFWRPSLFRPFHANPNSPDDVKILQELRFKSTPFGRVKDGASPNFHCSSVPQRYIHLNAIMPARLKHYGYMERAQRVKKLDWYTSIDWKNEAEDWYRHMCQGDSPMLGELPLISAMLREQVLNFEDLKRLLKVDPTERLLHAGPLEIKPWNEDEAWAPSVWAMTRRHG